MGEVTTPGAPAPQSSMSLGRRFIGIFFSPSETFADISKRPDFIIPLVIMVILSVVGTETFLAKIGLEPVIRWALEHSSRTASLPPDQLEQTITRVVAFQAILARVVSVVGTPLLALLVAVVGLITVRAIFGAELSFKTAFSIAAYANLVNVVFVVLTLILILFGDPEHAISNPQSLSPSSLGFFLNPVDTSKPLLALGGSLDVFTIWYMVLLGLGFSEATGRKVKFTSIFLVYLGLWLVVVLAKMGLATLG